MPRDARAAFGDVGERTLVIVSTCRDAEVAAGAIALGEAGDAERDAYRLHLSRCEHCVNALGGEREIERTMQRISDARDAETWQPAVSPVRQRPRRATGFAWGIGAVAAVVVAAVWFAAPHSSQPAHPAMVAATTVRAVPAQSHQTMRVAAVPVPQHVAVAPPIEHKRIVEHTVAPLNPPATVAVHHATVTHVAAVPAPKPPAAKAPTSSDERIVADTGTTSLPPQTPHAESLALLPAVVRDVTPVGGDNAIVPHPPRIAYYENAEGTTAIDVSVDERGTATKCTVTKPSGFVVLDDSVCAAAMHVRYVPRTVNGRAVSGSYHFAYGFHEGDDTPQP
jgi:TonB family protein